MSVEEQLETLQKQNEVIIKAFADAMFKLFATTAAMENALVDNNILTKEQLQQSFETNNSKLIETLQNIVKKD